MTEEKMKKEDITKKINEVVASQSELITPNQESISNTWGLSETSNKALKLAQEIHNTKHGLYAAIPMVCKENDCPYASVCPILKMGLTTYGERCTLEISLITKKYQNYMDELKIDEEDSVDLSLLKDLIDYDVQILRAENKMAVDGDFVKDQVIGVDENGDPIVQEQISNAANYKDKIQMRRNKTLELLNSTRKDKAGTKINVTMDPSSYATELLKKAEARKEVFNTEEQDRFDRLIQESGVVLDKNGNEIVQEGDV